MADQDDITTKLTELSRVLIADDGLDASLERVAALSTSLIGACDSCGVSLSRHGKVSTRAASDERADRVDEIQYSQHEGPCLQAITTGEAVVVDSFEDETRWSQFIDRAVEEGITASYSVPLTLHGGDVVGSLNYYSCHKPFSEADRKIGDLLAAQAAVGLRNAETFSEALNMVEQLNEALTSRDMIGQAKGMLMAKHDVAADEAFEMLRKASQHRNIKLRDVAARVAEGDFEVVDLTSAS